MKHIHLMMYVSKYLSTKIWWTSLYMSWIMWFFLNLNFWQMERIVEMMQDESTGVPVRTVKSFMSKVPSVFTGKLCRLQPQARNRNKTWHFAWSCESDQFKLFMHQWFLEICLSPICFWCSKNQWGIKKFWLFYWFQYFKRANYIFKKKCFFKNPL